MTEPRDNRLKPPRAQANEDALDAIKKEHAMYAHGYAAGIEAAKEKIDARLNNILCEMKEGYDDSIVGFNEAWDAVREAIRALRPPAAAGAQVRYIDGMTLGGEPLADWQQLGKQTTEAMRKRVRELATPPRDDFDRAVLCCLNDLEKRIEASAQAWAQPSEED